METYKIDDVAKECGLTKRTIRYYEEIGLLFPPERSKGGVRLYTRKHIDRLKQITNARDTLGFSLQEIQTFVSISEKLEDHRQEFRHTGDPARKKQELLEIEQIVAHQLQLIDQKLEKMMQIRQDIDGYYHRIRTAITKITP